MKQSLIILLVLSLNATAQIHKISLQYANDFLSKTDRYFTQGVKLNYIAPVFLKSPTKHIHLAHYVNGKRYAGFGIERNGFTPTSIRINKIPLGDRPYAGTTFLSSTYLVLNAQQKLRVISQVDLGLIGPLVGGKQEQTFIHEQIGDVLPLGWEYQIANDVIVNYTATLEKGIINHPNFTASTINSLRLGTLYTDASFGAMARAGWMHNYFNSISILEENKAFECYGFVKASSRIVGYNATMQGGLLSNSIYTLPSTSIERLVGELSYGINFSYKRIALSFSKFHITPEYKNGLTHGWGQLSIAYQFQ